MKVKRGTDISKIAILSVLLFFLTLGSAQNQHNVTVRNIEVPLRVYNGNDFVESLTIEDLELFEDGERQKIMALYLTRNSKIERQQAKRDYMPLLSRSFYFIFQLLDYNPKITEALDYFFEQIYEPGDYVVIMTVNKRYSLTSEALKSNPQEVVVDYIQTVIRNDTQIVSRKYNKLMKELISIVRGLSWTRDPWASDDTDMFVSASENLNRYKETAQKMNELRLVEEKKFVQFASKIKKSSGQQYVFFFYQREYRPYISASSMDPSLSSSLQEVFQFSQQDSMLDSVRISQAFADSSILFNFIFLGSNPQQISRVQMREISSNVKDIFSDVAYATGGLSDDSPNLAVAFKNATAVIRDCYILYYSPEKYVADGKYRKIEVKLKNRNYKVIHRRGYYAD